MIGQTKGQTSGSLITPSTEERAPADPSNNLGRGAPYDRDERIEQIRKEKSQGRPKEPERRPEDLDREDAAIHREGIADENPGIRPKGDADFAREKE